MKLNFVTGQGIQELRSQLLPLLDKCVQTAMHGEATAEDVLGLAIEGRAILAVGFGDDGRVDLVAALEPVHYPRMSSVNILALGGRTAGVMARLDAAGLIDAIKNWAIDNGFDALDAWASPAMSRLIHRFGFQPAYVHNRLTLGGKT